MSSRRLTAIYRVQRGQPVRHMVRTDYQTKQKLYTDLRSNGFRVLAILSDRQMEDIIRMDWHDLQLYEEYVKEVISKNDET